MGEDSQYTGMNEETNEVVSYLVYYPPPVSLDMLISLTGLSALSVLRAIEGLKDRKIITEKASHGKGLYFLNNPTFVAAERKKISAEDTKPILHKIIRLYSMASANVPEGIIALAELYMRLEEAVPEGFEYIDKAAALQLARGNKESAAQFYDFLCRRFMTGRIRPKYTKAFINSAIANITLNGHLLPVKEQIALLRKARSAAMNNDLPEHAARACLSLGRALIIADRHKEAFLHLAEARKLAKQIGDAKLLKEASISASDFLFWKGRVAEAVRHYEETLSDIEDLDDDELTLKAVAAVGLLYVICGRVARGLDVIETARSKAQALKMNEVLIIANLMRILSLIETRNTAEAESCLEELFSYPNETLGPYVLAVAHCCRAFVLATKNQCEEAFSHLQVGVDHLSAVGWTRYNASWVFECLDALETRGFRHDIINYDGAIRDFLTWDNIYMRGVALRYRAQRDIKLRSNTPRILSDLMKSDQCLKKAGAQIELARTHLALGRYYIDRGDTRHGQIYIDRAWRSFSKLNRQLFPEELITFLPQQRRIEIIMERTISIGETLGVIPEKSIFLDKMIDLAMDITVARRGGIFLVDGQGDIVPMAGRYLDPEYIGEGCVDKISAKIQEALRYGSDGVILEGVSDKGRFADVDITGLICAPIRLGRHLYGYLYLESHLGGGPFSNTDLLYARFLAKQIAIGLSNLTFYEEIRILKERNNEPISSKKEIDLGGPSVGIVGQSEAIKKAMTQVDQVAGTDSTVLITGETGVGKELIAKAIHKMSTRRDAPFIHVNLAAIPQELIPSELFGHEKGAFTGAVERHKGRFEIAHRGTVFLDEIGELPNAVQVKILGVLQERFFERLGSGRPIASDFRVIAATNRNLREAVEAGRFRRDLYYRLNVFPIHIPALKERREDIPLLAIHFLQKFAKKMGKNIRRITETGLNKLLAYDWPGNVRELEHYIERAVILTERDSNVLRLPEIPVTLVQKTTPAVQYPPLAKMEKEYIEKVLSTTRWKVSGHGGAASILGMNPKTLFSRMYKLGISKPNRRVSDTTH
ncbi:MAG: sigma 54-interacting transcriptional regulator [Deltaproteobacteria bacterium]|nr:sigma 54-interacting transcriptional regulator [Deltaproteobacteria bacterium]